MIPPSFHFRVKNARFAHNAVPVKTVRSPPPGSPRTPVKAVRWKILGAIFCSSFQGSKFRCGASRFVGLCAHGSLQSSPCTCPANADPWLSPGACAKGGLGAGLIHKSTQILQELQPPEDRLCQALCQLLSNHAHLPDPARASFPLLLAPQALPGPSCSALTPGVWP